uniref:Theileria-specific sub-telomeric protein, putative n=1 Tax=Theileria annulata TaxID=5874 RepID=A0A3B0N5C2_THEAN
MTTQQDDKYQCPSCSDGQAGVGQDNCTYLNAAFVLAGLAMMLNIRLSYSSAPYALIRFRLPENLFSVFVRRMASALELWCLPSMLLGNLMELALKGYYHIQNFQKDGDNHFNLKTPSTIDIDITTVTGTPTTKTYRIKTNELSNIHDTFKPRQIKFWSIIFPSIITQWLNFLTYVILLVVYLMGGDQGHLTVFYFVIAISGFVFGINMVLVYAADWNYIPVYIVGENSFPIVTSFMHYITTLMFGNRRKWNSDYLIVEIDILVAIVISFVAASVWTWAYVYYIDTKKENVIILNTPAAIPNVTITKGTSPAAPAITATIQANITTEDKCTTPTIAIPIPKDKDKVVEPITIIQQCQDNQCQNTTGGGGKKFGVPHPGAKLTITKEGTLTIEGIYTVKGFDGGKVIFEEKENEAGKCTIEITAKPTGTTVLFGHIFTETFDLSHVHWQIISPTLMVIVGMGLVYAIYPGIAPGMIVPFYLVDKIEMILLIATFFPPIIVATLQKVESTKPYSPKAKFSYHGENNPNTGMGGWQKYYQKHNWTGGGCANETDKHNPVYNWFWHFFDLLMVIKISLAVIFICCLHYKDSSLSRSIVNQPKMSTTLSIIFYMCHEFLLAIGFPGVIGNNGGTYVVLPAQYVGALFMIFLAFYSEGYIIEYKSHDPQHWPTEGMTKWNAFCYWCKRASKITNHNLRSLFTTDLRRDLLLCIQKNENLTYTYLTNRQLCGSFRFILLTLWTIKLYGAVSGATCKKLTLTSETSEKELSYSSTEDTGSDNGHNPGGHKHKPDYPTHTHGTSGCKYDTNRWQIISPTLMVIVGMSLVYAIYPGIAPGMIVPFYLSRPANYPVMPPPPIIVATLDLKDLKWT